MFGKRTVMLLLGAFAFAVHGSTGLAQRFPSKPLTLVVGFAAGVAPESVLLLTGSARLSATARALVTASLLENGPAAVREPMVRTIHSYAFAVLRLAAQRNGDPPPRLSWRLSGH